MIEPEHSTLETVPRWGDASLIIFLIFGGFLTFLKLLIEFVEFLKLFQHFFAAFFHDLKKF